MKIEKPKNIEGTLEAYLTEYQKIRDEILHYSSAHQQMIVLTLTSASLAIPILFGQTSQIPISVLVVIFNILSVIYSIIAINFITYGYSIGILGNYIKEYLSPRVNKLLSIKPGNKVLFWEEAAHRQKITPIELYLSSSGAVGAIVLMSIPSIISLLAAKSTSLLSVSNTNQNNLAEKTAASLIFPSSIIAWGFLGLSLLSDFLYVIFFFKKVLYKLED